ncbi:carotenoid oxygenase family protein [Streptomyces sp. NPDC001268]|uniref:carotenoid oxygenase family protein n=2 Tax=Streptomyces TaxID=1883 RepID=UPI003699F680
MSMTLEKPYISGHFTPVTDEITSHGLNVRGTLPPELNGRYFRNGHNPKPGVTPSHWFRGEGMIHGIRLKDGRSSSGGMSMSASVRTAVRSRPMVAAA